VLLHETTSLCRSCKNAVPARVVSHDGRVVMEKTCPVHGAQSVELSDDVGWYERTRALAPKKNPPSLAVHEKAVHHGCPFDCGPCESHEQKVRLPVVTITSACNLDCPICYVHNKNDDAFHMREEAFRKTVDALVKANGGALDILNITGGEPTLHPQFLDFLDIARAAGVHRTTVCTNGIKIVTDPNVAPRLAQIGDRVALSFDTFEEEADVLLQGAKLFELKMKCLDVLEQHDVDTTLIPVMTRGVNDHEIGKIVELLLTRRNIRHLEVHTMTFTGQSGTTFDRGGRISIREVLERIEETTGGLLHVDDFVPSPCAHPLCYQIAYLLLDPDGGPPVPFTRFLTRDEIYEALSDRLYLEPTPKLEAVFRAAIDRLWTEEPPDHERMLGLIKRVLDDTSLKATERAIKAIYVHSHMDEETFDVERAAQCCDSNCYADGSTIPVCNYNVLYREKEARFNHQPREWNERSGGKRALPVVHA
jgi:7,8-dihydro-6-hydroxymethylpterin dimethyltransferase